MCAVGGWAVAASLLHDRQSPLAAALSNSAQGEISLTVREPKEGGGPTEAAKLTFRFTEKQSE
jgi:hypothetical protein